MSGRRYGIGPAAPPQAVRAATALAALPLRLDLDTPPRPPDVVRAAGYVAGVDEAAALLEAWTGLPRRAAEGFGGTWWWLGDGEVLAPGVPVAVGEVDVSGPDGVYRRDAAGIAREAGGREAVVVGAAAEGAGARPDLLAFGPAERYLVADGRLEVEDLFATLRLPAEPVLLDRLLARGLRCPAASLDGLPPPAPGPVTLTVRRDAALVGDAWRDPAAVIAHRPEIERVRRRGDDLEARTADGRDLRLALAVDAHGWRAELVAGDHPLRCHDVRGEPDGGVVAYTVELAAGRDPFAAGLRGRLAFDLYAVLVALA